MVSVPDHTIDPGRTIRSTTLGIYHAFFAMLLAKFVPGDDTAAAFMETPESPHVE